MTKRELKKLSRADLIEMLIEQSIELNELKEKHAVAETELQNRTIAIDNAGSIAEASLKLTEVFFEAEKSAQIYLQNIQLLSERQETVCEEREKECQERIDSLISETEKRCNEKEAETNKRCKEKEEETEQRCNAMVAKAKRESQAYWDAISKRLDDYYSNHQNLREMLGVIAKKTEAGNEI